MFASFFSLFVFLFVDSRGRSVPFVLCVLLLCVLFICHYPIPSEPTIRHSIILRREKTHQLLLAIPYRHSQTLVERAVASCLLRGCGDLTRAARRVSNDSGGIRAKKRLSGALLSSENWLMQGEMAVPCCVLKRRLARGAALPCCVLKRSTGAIVRPRTCAKNRAAPGN